MESYTLGSLVKWNASSLGDVPWKGEFEDGGGIWESMPKRSPLSSHLSLEFQLMRNSSCPELPGWLFLVIQRTEILGAAPSLNPWRDRKGREGKKTSTTPSSCVGCSSRSRKNIRGLKEKCHRSKGAPGEERGREMLLLPSALSTELQPAPAADPGGSGPCLELGVSLGAAIPWEVSCHEFREC